MKLKKIFLILFGFLSFAFSKDDFKRFLNDNGGGLVLSFGKGNHKDLDWLEYKQLKVDESIKSINPKDLPEDFCYGACRIVD